VRSAFDYTMRRIAGQPFKNGCRRRVSAFSGQYLFEFVHDRSFANLTSREVNGGFWRSESRQAGESACRPT